MDHSKTAKLRSEQAVRTRESARTSSTVSITTIGVEELMRIFSRSIGFMVFGARSSLLTDGPKSSGCIRPGTGFSMRKTLPDPVLPALVESAGGIQSVSAEAHTARFPRPTVQES